MSSSISGQNISIPDIDPTEFVKVCETRRSVRVFKPESIPEDVINRIIDMGLLAPNSSNMQVWQFFRVTSSEKKKSLQEACLSQPAATTASELIVCVARTKTWRSIQKQMVETLEKAKAPEAAISYYRKLVPLAYENGPFGLRGLFKRVYFFFKGLQSPMVRGPVSEKDLRLWAVKSTALACENMMLAARAFGFDSCPMEGFDEVRVKKILNLPSDAVVTMVIGFGRRDAKGIYGPRIRMPRDQFVFEV